MRTILLGIGALSLVAVVGCSKSQGLSKANIDEVYKSGQGQSFDERVKGATDKLGAPTKVEGDKTIWIAKDGSKCTEFYVQKYPGGRAGAGKETVDCK